MVQTSTADISTKPIKKLHWEKISKVFVHRNSLPCLIRLVEDDDACEKKQDLGSL